jgi:hypothetical protein
MSKYLTESGWKAVVQKFKVADNGLQKALAAYEKLAEDKHKERLDALDLVDTLGLKLKTLLNDGIKTAKAQKALPEVTKNLVAAIDYLTEVLDASKVERKEIEALKDKAVAQSKAAEPPMLERLVAVAQTVSGSAGGRLRKVMAMAAKKGNSGYKSLWFYNYAAAARFVQFHTTQEERRKMTKGTNGKLPFSGDSGHGDWQIFPFQDSLNNVCRKGCPDKDLVTFLTWMDGQILYSINEMSRVQSAGDATGGGSAFGPSVDEFITHVGNLAKDSSHLYSAGY